MKSMPNDPMILLSYVNTQLRDFYSSPGELCEDAGWSEQELTARLSQINYHYDFGNNRFA